MRRWGVLMNETIEYRSERLREHSVPSSTDLWILMIACI